MQGGPIPRFVSKWRGFFLLSRPVNVAIAMMSIYVAAVLTGHIESLQKVIMACLSGGLIAAAANAINDYYDVEIDRINRPGRPLPRALISMKEALVFSLLGFAGGISMSLSINFYAFLIATTFSLLLFWYSSHLKRTVVLGNLTVSLATAFAFIYGGVAAGHFEHALIPAAFAFLMHFGREIIKDMEDVEGDRANQARTLPIVHGFSVAKSLVTATLGLLVFLTLVPHFLHIYGRWYFYIVMFGVNGVILIVLLSMWKNPHRTNLRRLSAVLKADMLVGLLAIYAGRW